MTAMTDGGDDKVGGAGGGEIKDESAISTILACFLLATVGSITTVLGVTILVD